ncbi:hypothetical protein DP113_34095 (plasmid) [Brasilonema octagenarum UFV-E1]|uniref:Uncharacterized protein n=2 Tax=Brasilonema TaxID=383614 RepID=A0A856MQB7_9CYAN|nr:MULTISPECIES: hypothetical protein [Brasilonema]NMF62505.1 hypothetical protein [Brasilonema octagenarum UFV-OR1]QDL12759.1 hypothetical protein DP114_33985 [Brasilonema sennae CENA114]QDL19155.1 hypothetical protein DP113_34095 [Brasilonema octagenarum UFV-E1]
MQAKPSPLYVIINPPGVQDGMPGDTLEVHAVIINQGDQSAIIDVFFDEGFQSIDPSFVPPRERLALSPQQSNEVSFEFQIPFNAQPGTYHYTLVVDAPEHYPQNTPIHFARQVRVLLKEQTAIRANDPTFSLQPTTNPHNQLIYKGNPLQIVATVENRSLQVDSFRLVCPDFEEDWITIRYPATGLEAQGLLLDRNKLELNPSSVGQIFLQFHPPANTLAGSYSPTIRLYSRNSPELVLLDLVYIQVPETYHLGVELNTLLGKVSRTSGKYEVKIANQSNLVRELRVSAKSCDEEELCTYKYAPPQTKVFPGKSSAVSLEVKPNQWWRRPFFGEGLVINFQIDIEDIQGLPVPETLPKGTLVWKSRPIWQLLSLILIALGLVGGVAFLIWRLLNPDPLRLEDLRSDSSSYREGDQSITLSWNIYNFNQLKKLELKTNGPVPSKPRVFDFGKGIPDELDKKCSKLQQEVLSCNEFKTDATTPGKYSFELTADLRNGKRVTAKTSEVEIVALPAPEVVSVRPNKYDYIKGQPILLSWDIKNPKQLSVLNIVTKQDGQTPVGQPITYTFKQGNNWAIPSQLNSPPVSQPKNSLKGQSKIPSKTQSKNLCSLQQIEQNETLTCINVPVASSTTAGKYSFELQACYKSCKQPNSKSIEGMIEVKIKPTKIVYFRLNGNEERTRNLENGQPLILEWKVEGDEEINVYLSTEGRKVKPLGKVETKAIKALEPKIELIVTDKSGKPLDNRIFSITVIDKPVSIPKTLIPKKNNERQPAPQPVAPNSNL